ncbi:MAG: AbrB/MazE/SpoVT family DNA-binding domain-containing protein [Patescibacteria group bacterium]
MANSKLKYQKIIKVGNSLAITLDSDFIVQTGVKAGDQVAVNYQPDQKVVSYSPVADNGVMKVADGGAVEYEAKSKLASAITPELEAWTKKFLKENKESLKKLANL